MAPFEKLQEIWQQQDAPFAPRFDPSAVTRGFRRYGRRQDWLNGAKLVLIAIQIAWMFWSLRQLGALALLGAAMIAAAEIAFLAIDWRAQRRIAKSDFADPSIVFIDAAIERLRRQKSPCGGYMWHLLAIVVVGLNLILWNAAPDSSPLHRLWTHAGATVFSVLSFRVGVWVRTKRFEKECQPLLAQLDDMRRALVEGVR
jgi:hypothetical protein